MKRPAARLQGKLVKRRSLCGSVSHRLERCKIHGAKKVRQMAARLKVLEDGRPNNHTLRIEHKVRKSPKTTGDKYVTKAMKTYTGKNFVDRQRSPGDVRLRLPTDRAVATPAQEQAAADWLLEHGWATEPSVCAECHSDNVTELVFPAHRKAHWRCCSCGYRMWFLTRTIFTGLRCALSRVKALLLACAGSSLTTRPKVADLVQQTSVGKTTCMHFVQCLRHIEATAGEQICASTKLSGKVEVDGSFITQSASATSTT
ncbi:unnamed protein product [Effrenium voratum]|nr:unnamed protein product [Effrenium voratum]